MSRIDSDMLSLLEQDDTMGDIHTRRKIPRKVFCAAVSRIQEGRTIQTMREHYRRFRSPNLDTAGTEQLVSEMRQIFGETLASIPDEEVLPIVFLCAQAVRNDWRGVIPSGEQ